MSHQEDVEVLLSHKLRLKLHASILTRHSKLFREMLTEDNAAKLGPAARKAGHCVRWVVQLERLPTEEFPAGKLGLVAVDNKGGYVKHPVALLPRNENGLEPLKVFNYYASILNAFNGDDIPICDNDMPQALEDAVAMIQIAEYLCCIPIIRKPIDNALFKQGQVLFRSIASHPWAWVSMAYRVQSEMVYKEALIHLAGNWVNISANMKSAMDAPVRKVCQRLHDELTARRKNLEMTIACMYPGGMATPTTELPIRREEYGKEILVWMALCFFRHWFTQRLLDNKGLRSRDGGFEFYSSLGAGGEAYMDKCVINQFHLKFPMTKKAMNVCENHICEIKECVKAVVERQGILKSECMLDVNRYPVKYLTSIEVQDKDIPWKLQDAEMEDIRGD